MESAVAVHMKGFVTDERGEVLVVCAVRSLAQSQMLRRVATAKVLAAEAERSRIARDGEWLARTRPR